MTRGQKAFLIGMGQGLLLAVVGFAAMLLGGGVWGLLSIIVGDGWALAILISTLVGSSLWGLFVASAAFDDVEEDDL